MKNWNKRNIPKETVLSISKTYGIDALTASILARRGITKGKDILFFLEDSSRFLHNPFLFSNMEKVVDRLLRAQKDGEKVLIFGDSDVDGITSTALLFDSFSALELDVRWRLPSGNDPYGLNKNAIDEFEKEGGSLIVTVDCGISNVEEIAYAQKKGIETIVLDHHNPPELLPDALIIDPKCADSGYPFKDISGCAVAYKVASALRFSQTNLYKGRFALLFATIEQNGSVKIEAVRTKNLVQREKIAVSVTDFSSIFETKLPDFLSGEQIFVWNEKKTRAALTKAFGNEVDFSLIDFREDAAKVWKWASALSLEDLKGKSKMATYKPEESGEIETFFNLFVTYCTQKVLEDGNNFRLDERDLQLVALAALSDIMPLLDENRIFVKNGTKSLSNPDLVREGLKELFSKQEILGKRITSTILSWNVIPVLNATGRLRQPEIGLRLLLEKDAAKREEISKKIIEMNEERKRLGALAWELGCVQAKKSIEEHDGKLCVIVDERVNRGVSGILAGKLVSTYNVPSMAITSVGDVAIGSMRSCRQFDATEFLTFLDSCGKDGSLFISYGGHNYAAGFSFKKERTDEFLQEVKKACKKIKLGEDESEQFDVDAEIPERFLTPAILDIADSFEPYGEENRELIFMSRALKIDDCQIVGKGEKQHLKIIFDCKETKWPAMIWGGAQMLHRDFEKGDKVDVLYSVGRNVYQGIEKPQMIIKDIKKVV